MSIKLNIPKRAQEDIDVLLPIMSLLLILIPVLVGNMAFYQLHAVRVNTPGVSKEMINPDTLDKKTVKVMLKLRISEEIFEIELLDENSGNVIIKKEITRDRTGIVYLKKELKKLSKEYEKLDVILLYSHKKLKYGELLPILDEGIRTVVKENGKSAFKIVIIPEEA
jgi:hypothetical protein